MIQKYLHTFLLSLFAVNFDAFNFKLDEVWLPASSNFLWLKIKGMKISSFKLDPKSEPDR